LLISGKLEGIIAGNQQFNDFTLNDHLGQQTVKGWLNLER